MRAQRAEARRYGAALLQRQGLAAWIEAAAPLTRSRNGNEEAWGPDPGGLAAQAPCHGLVPILADLVMARGGEEWSC